eukprot:CAMPEP_0172494250 /NCGR_PEP_ID=MMETSP1066-20121228/42792_1 /TAXON_ID=671091 /ORGANISM="Coscinodiscus wailesii, Strain CCMP2513" /LENGTH=61 /DNA_ID=CAMNT_0013265077 /DNA_START=13 /DNA_END=195 /DNA_ORIENTATION=-
MRVCSISAALTLLSTSTVSSFGITKLTKSYKSATTTLHATTTAPSSPPPTLEPFSPIPPEI